MRLLSAIRNRRKQFLSAVALLLLTPVQAPAAEPAPEWLKNIGENIRDNPVALIRGVFNYVLTPLAVIVVFWILIKNIIRVVNQGFSEDKMEGYQRTCVAVLPFPFLVWAMLGASGADDLAEWFNSIGGGKLFIFSAIAGGGVALEVFKIVEHKGVLVERLLLLFLSGVTCLTSYMFLGVGVGLAVNVAFGLLVGLCVTAIFANLKGGGGKKKSGQGGD